MYDHSSSNQFTVRLHKQSSHFVAWKRDTRAEKSLRSTLRHLYIFKRRDVKKSHAKLSVQQLGDNPAQVGLAAESSSWQLVFFFLPRDLH